MWRRWSSFHSTCPTTVAWWATAGPAALPVATIPSSRCWCCSCCCCRCCFFIGFYSSPPPLFSFSVLSDGKKNDAGFFSGYHFWVGFPLPSSIAPPHPWRRFMALSFVFFSDAFDRFRLVHPGAKPGKRLSWITRMTVTFYRVLTEFYLDRHFRFLVARRKHKSTKSTGCSGIFFSFFLVNHLLFWTQVKLVPIGIFGNGISVDLIAIRWRSRFCESDHGFGTCVQLWPVRWCAHLLIYQIRRPSTEFYGTPSSGRDGFRRPFAVSDAARPTKRKKKTPTKNPTDNKTNKMRQRM